MAHSPTGCSARPRNMWFSRAHKPCSRRLVRAGDVPRHHRPPLRPLRRSSGLSGGAGSGRAGAVGLCPVQLARKAGARVIATVRRPTTNWSPRGPGPTQSSGRTASRWLMSWSVSARLPLRGWPMSWRSRSTRMSPPTPNSWRSVGRSLPTTPGTRGRGCHLGVVVQECPGVLPGQRRLPGRGEGRRSPRPERRPGEGVAGVRVHPDVSHNGGRGRTRGY